MRVLAHQRESQFVGLRLSGDPVQLMLGDSAQPEAIEALPDWRLTSPHKVRPVSPP